MLVCDNAPKGVLTSDKFEVFVNGQPLSVYTALWGDGRTNYNELPEELFKIYDGLRHVSFAEKTFFAGFATDKKADIKIRCKGANSFTVLPESANIDFKQNGDTISFTMDPKQMLTIEADGDIFGALALFCDPIIPFNPKGYKNVIRFEKGLHTVENNEYLTLDEHNTPILSITDDDTYVYIETGAVVRAAALISGAKNVTIEGGGVMSLLSRCYGYDADFKVEGDLYAGFRDFAMPMVYIKSGAENITLRGVYLNCEFRGVNIRNANGITLDNIKIFASSVNADGFNTVNTSNVLIKDSYIRSSDDAVCMYTGYDSIPHLNDDGYTDLVHICENYEVVGCHLLTNARPFQFAGHASGCKDPHDRISDLYVHDCEVIDIGYNTKVKMPLKHRQYWSGILRILSQTEQSVENVTFERININWTKNYEGKAIHLEVRSSADASYVEKQGYRIKNVRFKDIFFNNCPDDILPSVILFKPQNAPADYEIADITFDNVCYNGISFKDIKNPLDILGNCNNIIIK